MNSLKNPLIFSALVLVLSACGVKGDPLPPEKPADLGRGRPTYKRATEKIKVESLKPSDSKPRRAQDEEEDDNE